VSRRVGRCLRATLTALTIACVWRVAPATAQVASTNGVARSTVLVLIPMQPGRPLFDMFARGIIDEFVAGPPVAVAIEHLFDVLEPPDVNARQLGFLRAKYAGRRIDAVIAIGHPRYARLREELGLTAGVPIVYLEAAPAIPPVPNSTRLRLTSTVASSYEFVRGLRPGPHHVALIGGDSRADRIGNAATLARLAELVPPDRLIDLTQLTLDETRERVRTLPDDTFLLIGDVLSEPSGRPLSYPALLASLAPVVRVPVVVATDVLVGQGALGGRVYELRPLGARLAQVARRLVDGMPADRIPAAVVETVPVLDAHQLQRFGIPESRVPAGTVVRFREPSMWTEYRAWLLAGTTALVLQAVVIAGLLAERRRRRASQRRLAERLRLQALVAEISTAFANVTAHKVEIQMEASLENVGHALKAEDCAIWTWRGPDEAPRLVCRWLTRAGALPVTSVLDDALLAWARERLERGEEVHVADAADASMASPMPAPPPSVLLLPLRVDGRVIGVFALRHTHAEPWTPDMLGGLRTIGEIIATAVVRKRADSSTRAQLETLAHVNRVAGLGELAAAIAHELNQPLAAILANTEVAHHLLGREDPPFAEIRDIVTDVIIDDERAGGIIRNMRAMLRHQRVDAEPVDVNAVATDVRRLVQHDPRLRSRALDLVLGDGVPPVTIDATQLTQVVLNLVTNAVDAMAGSSDRHPIRLRTEARAGGASIEVSDHGPGIPDDVLGRLFDPFFTTKADGLGVGLAISRSILEAAGGRISAANGEDAGAIFRVWLPASPPPAGDPLAAGVPSTARPA
jgi:C4-dicarboxylate-specific signal transduction histidine kinase